MSGTAAETSRQEALLRLARRRSADARARLTNDGAAQANDAPARTTDPTAAPTTPDGPAPGVAPLSHAQHRMWLMERLGQGGAVYNVPLATRVRGPFDAEAFARALTGLVRRHEVLRTRYGQGPDGEPYQEVTAARPVPVRTVTASGDTAERLLREEAARPFDLAAGPLPRALHLRHADDDHTVLLTFHHIAVDGGSVEIIARELDERYRAERERPAADAGTGAAHGSADAHGGAGTRGSAETHSSAEAHGRAEVHGASEARGGGDADEFPAPRYADFARRERAGSPALETGLAYWTERLAGARPVPLPRAAAADGRGEARLLAAPLGATALDGLRATGRAHRATLFTVVLAAAFATLLEATGEEDLVIGCASSHRDLAGARDLVGLCVNTLPIRPELSGAADFSTLLSRVRDALLEAQQHRHVPFDLMVERLDAAARDSTGEPLVGVTVDLLGPPCGLRLADAVCTPLDIELEGAKFGLGLYVDEGTDDTGPRCLVRYDRGRLDAAAAGALLGRFAGLLESAAEDPGRRLSRAVGSREPLGPDEPLAPERAPASAAPTPASTSAQASASTSAQASARDGEPSPSVSVVAEVFGELLGERPGPDGDFFLLGGHSLLAVRVAERLRERLRAPLTGLDVLEHRTPRALGALLDGRARPPAAERAAGRATTSTAPIASARAGTVLVTGGTGGVGAFVLRELAARGRPVRALARPESAHLVAADGVEVVEGDLADVESLRAAVDGVDSVIHAACTFTSPDVDVTAMRALLDGWRRGAFVFVSSVDAYGRPSVVEVAEDTPSEEPLSAYGRAKLECERMLWEAAGTGGRGGASVVRAPIVWGAHPRLRDQLRWGATGALFQAARTGDPVVLPAAGSVPASGDTWSGAPWVHAAALARALVSCVERPAHGTVNAIGGHVGWAEFAQELIRLLDSPSRIVPAPESAPGLTHRHRYRAEALAEELVARPGEDWRSVIAAMLEV
ncbi:condensation domain-containing protein [Streptomyces sp. SAJ15]|uniref:condensation domain-containing protein n=1 Tax=Streptomyces sp. SAJ15 TaxID=2011095 RepID=UPI001186A4E2|nr:condensation domain-containing protein [Streptomyces sp. SAJ15]TVL90371.1 non-ribosomal peptide synthetase/polyketide synthase [Streptomyces sp. SAJ15]